MALTGYSPAFPCSSVGATDFVHVRENGEFLLLEPASRTCRVLHESSNQPLPGLPHLSGPGS